MEAGTMCFIATDHDVMMTCLWYTNYQMRASE